MSMTRTLAAISLSGPATQALERSTKRRRLSNEKEEVNNTKPDGLFSFDDIFDTLSQEVSDEESFPSIGWDFDDE